MNDFAKLKNAILPPTPPATVEQEPPIDFDKVVKKPKRGGLPIELIASIQKEYQREKINPQVPQGAEPQKLALKSGWGGKGR